VSGEGVALECFAGCVVCGGGLVAVEGAGAVLPLSSDSIEAGGDAVGGRPAGSGLVRAGGGALEEACLVRERAGRVHGGGRCGVATATATAMAASSLDALIAGVVPAALANSALRADLAAHAADILARSAPRPPSARAHRPQPHRPVARDRHRPPRESDPATP